MKVYWNGCGRGIDANEAKSVVLDEALLIWSDEVHGVEGNFIGFVDDDELVVQFYFDEDIPDHVGDAGHLKIVLMDFPQPDLRGSYVKHVRIGEVDDLIQTVFRMGASHLLFRDLRFEKW